MKDIWVASSTSCKDCNVMATATFDHIPTEEDKENIEEKMGGMQCIITKNFKMEINGEAIVGNIIDY